MNNFSENALLSHIQSSQLKKIVATVFQHHTMFPSFFGGIHQLPTLINRKGSRNFHRDMFPLLHSIDRNRSMQLPMGTIINQIYIASFTNLLPTIGATIFHGRSSSLRSQNPLRFGNLERIYIAQRNHPHTFYIHKTFHGCHAPSTYPYKSNPYCIQRFSS